MKNVLITGGTGFVGRYLVANRIEAGDDVSVLTRHGSPPPAFPEPIAQAFSKADLVPWSGQSIDELKDILSSRQFDTVFHLASAGIHPNDRDVSSLIEANVVMSAEIAKSAAASGAVYIAAGSCSEYRDPPDNTRLQENDPIQMARIYGASKAAATAIGLATTRHLGGRGIVCRLFMVYGAGEAPHRLLPTLVSGLGQGRKTSLSAGAQKRDFTYVEDAVSGLAAAAQRASRSGSGSAEIFNIATGVATSVREFSLEVASQMNTQTDLLDFGAIDPRPDDIPFLVGNGEAMRTKTGWKPQYDVSAGISCALNYYREIA